MSGSVKEYRDYGDILWTLLVKHELSPGTLGKRLKSVLLWSKREGREKTDFQKTSAPTSTDDVT